MPVNRPAAIPIQTPGPDERLYLRDQELDQGAALIRTAARRLNQLVEDCPAAAGLTAPELDILQELLDRGAMDVGTLRDRMRLPRQSLARNLSQLEARTLVTRATAGSDRRRRLVSLTDDGARLAREVTVARRAALRQAFLSVGPDAVNGARRVLGEVLKAAGHVP